MKNDGIPRTELIHEFERAVGAGLFDRPALAHDTVQSRSDQKIELGVVGGDQLRDGLARALQEASGFAVCQTNIVLNQIGSQLYNHTNPTEPAPLLKERGALIRCL